MILCKSHFLAKKESGKPCKIWLLIFSNDKNNRNKIQNISFKIKKTNKNKNSSRILKIQIPKKLN